MTNGAESIQHDGTATVIHVVVCQLFFARERCIFKQQDRPMEAHLSFLQDENKQNKIPKRNNITKIKSYLDLGLLFVTHSLPWDQNLLLQWSGHHESDQCLLLTLSFCFLHPRDLPSVEVMVKMADVLKEIRHLALCSGHGLRNCLDDCCAKAYYVLLIVSKDC